MLSTARPAEENHRMYWWPQTTQVINITIIKQELCHGTSNALSHPHPRVSLGEMSGNRSTIC
jgi:hypothetical protein